MTFRYILRTPDGAAHYAATPAEFDALVDKLLAENPGSELSGEALVVNDVGMGPGPRSKKQEVGARARNDGIPFFAR